jgi:hypothetical protein
MGEQQTREFAIMKPRRTVHSPNHWIPVAMVLAATLFMLSEAHGQHTGAAAVFEGRPAMAGAQAGQGALAGPPQGGVGVQGAQDAGVSISRPAAGVTPRDEMRAANANADAAANSNASANTSGNAVVPKRSDVDLAPRQDSGIARDERSAAKKTEQAAKRMLRKDQAPAMGGSAN